MLHNPPSDEALEFWRERLSSMSKVWENQGGVNKGYTYYFDKFKESPNTEGEIHNACHSWITKAYYQSSGRKVSNNFWDYSGQDYTACRPFVVLNCYSPSVKKCSMKGWRALIDWIVSDKCPFAKYVLNKDTCVEDTGIILLCGGPEGATQIEAMWLCKVMRYATEGSKHLNSFAEFIEGGVDPMLAICLATNLNYTESSGQFTFGKVCTHGSVFHGAYPVDDIVPALIERRLNLNAEQTTGLFSVKSDHKNAIENFVVSLVKPKMVDDGWGGKIRVNGADKETIISKVLELQNKYVPVQPKEPDKGSVYLEIDL